MQPLSVQRNINIADLLAKSLTTLLQGPLESASQYFYSIANFIYCLCMLIKSLPDNVDWVVYFLPYITALWNMYSETSELRPPRGLL